MKYKIIANPSSIPRKSAKNLKRARARERERKRKKETSPPVVGTTSRSQGSDADSVLKYSNPSYAEGLQVLASLKAFSAAEKYQELREAAERSETTITTQRLGFGVFRNAVSRAKEQVTNPDVSSEAAASDSLALAKLSKHHFDKSLSPAQRASFHPDAIKGRDMAECFAQAAILTTEAENLEKNEDTAGATQKRTEARELLKTLNLEDVERIAGLDKRHMVERMIGSSSDRSTTFLDRAATFAGKVLKSPSLSRELYNLATQSDRPDGLRREAARQRAKEFMEKFSLNTSEVPDSDSIKQHMSGDVIVALFQRYKDKPSDLSAAVEWVQRGVPANDLDMLDVFVKRQKDVRQEIKIGDHAQGVTASSKDDGAMIRGISFAVPEKAAALLIKLGVDFPFQFTADSKTGGISYSAFTPEGTPVSVDLQLNPPEETLALTDGKGKTKEGKHTRDAESPVAKAVESWTVSLEDLRTCCSSRAVKMVPMASVLTNLQSTKVHSLLLRFLSENEIKTADAFLAALQKQLYNVVVKQLKSLDAFLSNGTIRTLPESRQDSKLPEISKTSKRDFLCAIVLARRLATCVFREGFNNEQRKICFHLYVEVLGVINKFHHIGRRVESFGKSCQDEFVKCFLGMVLTTQEPTQQTYFFSNGMFWTNHPAYIVMYLSRFCNQIEMPLAFKGPLNAKLARMQESIVSGSVPVFVLHEYWALRSKLTPRGDARIFIPVALAKLQALLSLTGYLSQDLMEVCIALLAGEPMEVVVLRDAGVLFDRCTEYVATCRGESFFSNEAGMVELKLICVKLSTMIENLFEYLGVAKVNNELRIFLERECLQKLNGLLLSLLKSVVGSLEGLSRPIEDSGKVMIMALMGLVSSTASSVEIWESAYPSQVEGVGRTVADIDAAIARAVAGNALLAPMYSDEELWEMFATKPPSHRTRGATATVTIHVQEPVEASGISSSSSDDDDDVVVEASPVDHATVHHPQAPFTAWLEKTFPAPEKPIRQAWKAYTDNDAIGALALLERLRQTSTWHVGAEEVGDQTALWTCALAIEAIAHFDVLAKTIRSAKASGRGRHILKLPFRELLELLSHLAKHTDKIKGVLDLDTSTVDRTVIRFLLETFEFCRASDTIRMVRTYGDAWYGFVEAGIAQRETQSGENRREKMASGSRSARDSLVTGWVRTCLIKGQTMADVEALISEAPVAIRNIATGLAKDEHGLLQQLFEDPAVVSARAMGTLTDSLKNPESPLSQRLGGKIQPGIKQFALRAAKARRDLYECVNRDYIEQLAAVHAALAERVPN